MWRDGENYELSLHNGEHEQLFIGIAIKGEGRHKMRQSTTNQSTIMNQF